MKKLIIIVLLAVIIVPTVVSAVTLKAKNGSNSQTCTAYGSGYSVSFEKVGSQVKVTFSRGSNKHAIWISASSGNTIYAYEGSKLKGSYKVK